MKEIFVGRRWSGQGELGDVGEKSQSAFHNL